MMEEVNIEKAVTDNKIRRDEVSKFTPLQIWHEIISNTHMFRELVKMDEEQSNALYVIEDICQDQKDKIYFPKKKKK
tara:strand:+ start:68 stop:298 length:231 start_codon:yes stop_codon:yes gene_type:complete